MLAMLEDAPVTAVISGEELDTIIREAYVLGNHVRRKLVMALDAMYSGRLYITPIALIGSNPGPLTRSVPSA